MPRIAFSFAGCTVPADIDCPPELFSILASFGVEAGTAESAARPSIIVSRTGDRFNISGPAYVTPFSVAGIDAAAGSVMAGLAACKSLSVEEHVLCIHGAAARIGDRGYLGLARFGTGKSSLMAELARRGADILSDDVVLVDTRDRTMAGLQIPFRLRQSFIRSASPAMTEWLAARTILSGPRYTFLAPGVLMPGQHPLTDIVLLNRVGEAGEAETDFEPASPGMLIPRLLWHNMSRHHAASSIAAMASALAAHVQGSILYAANVGQAAAHLLSGARPVSSGRAHQPLSTLWRDDLHILRTDRGAIISDDQSGRIFDINESALVILTLLQSHDERDEILALLRAIYPDVPESELAGHLSDCIRHFADSGIIDLSYLLLLETVPPGA